MRVKLHPDARAELRAARKWYYERSPLSAFAFAQTVQNAISRIKEAPNTFPLSDHGTRKLVLQRFPFNMFYRAGVTEIVIVAVAHQKQVESSYQNLSKALAYVTELQNSLVEKKSQELFSEYLPSRTIRQQ